MVKREWGEQRGKIGGLGEVEGAEHARGVGRLVGGGGVEALSGKHAKEYAKPPEDTRQGA